MPGIEDALGVQWRAAGDSLHANILVDWYEPVLVDALNNVTKWWSMITADSKHVQVGGKFIGWPTHTGRSTGSNFMDPRGDLPRPGSQKYKWHTNHIKDYYGRILIDGKTMRHSRTNRGSYLNAVNSEMEGIVQDAIIDFQRTALNDGSGRLAEVNDADPGVPNAGEVTVALHGGINQSTTAGNAATQHFFPGQRIAFITETGGSVVHKYVVSVPNATTLEVSGAEDSDDDSVTGIANGDWIVRISDETTAINDTSFRNEFLGLEGIFSTGPVPDGNGASVGQTGSYDFTTAVASLTAFQGIPTAGNLFNQAILFDNSGTPRDLTDELMQQALSGIERPNNADINLILMPYGVYNNYLTDLFPDKRYAGNNLEAGGTIASFHGIPIYKEKDMWGGRVYFVDTNQLRIQEVEPLTWLNQDGSMWNRVPNKDSWEAAFVKSCQMMVYVRERAGGSLLDLNEDELVRAA